jgi:hypothetical protein
MSNKTRNITDIIIRNDAVNAAIKTACNATRGSVWNVTGNVAGVSAYNVTLNATYFAIHAAAWDAIDRELNHVK